MSTETIIREWLKEQEAYKSEFTQNENFPLEVVCIDGYVDFSTLVARLDERFGIYWE